MTEYKIAKCCASCHYWIMYSGAQHRRGWCQRWEPSASVNITFDCQVCDEWTLPHGRRGPIPNMTKEDIIMVKE